MPIYEFKRAPLTHQREILKQTKDKKRVALWLPPGAGKTKIATDLIQMGYLKYRLQKILIVAPLSALGVWEYDMHLDWGIDTPFTSYMIRGRNRGKLLQEAMQHKGITVVITNYDINRSNLATDLLKYKPDIAILDESDSVKNHRSKRYKYFKKYLDKTKKIICLTGTPFRSSLDDLYGQINFLDKDILGNFKSYSDRYTVRDYMFPSKIVKTKNMQEFTEKIKDVAIQISDSDLNLPPITVANTKVKIENKTKKVYDDMLKNMISMYENNTLVSENIAVNVLRLQQISSGFFPTENGMKTLGLEKLHALKDLIENTYHSESLLIGCRFLAEIEWIKNNIKDVDFICGGVSAEERRNKTQEFQKGDTRVLCFQVAAATAVTLTKARIGILLSSTYSLGDYYQWMKRIHRIGSTKPVYIKRLVLESTLDSVVYSTIDKRGDFLRSIAKDINILKGG